MSPRHLSFVETGRSKPSRELLLTLARHLEVPLRDRNALLVAAGYAPRFNETSIDDPVSAHVLASLKRLLATHDPYPGVVLDRHWNIVLANDAASQLIGGLPAGLLTPKINAFRISLHPDGLAAITLNFAEWAFYLLSQLRRLVMMSADHDLVELEREVLAYPNIAEHLIDGEPGDRGEATREEPRLLVPCRLNMGGVELSLFTTLTTFGTPNDITLDELAVELFFPADDATEAIMRGTGGGPA